MQTEDMKICANCGKEFEPQQRERYCRRCRVSYTCYLRAGAPRENVGFASSRFFNDRYSKKLRDGFDMINGSFNQ